MKGHTLQNLWGHTGGINKHARDIQRLHQLLLWYMAVSVWQSASTVSDKSLPPPPLSPAHLLYTTHIKKFLYIIQLVFVNHL